eukprot:CAMPEP_0184500572 /NCGR_PEP_ID=MMETSP0113_2-20130426/45232_1 /TAXON_ID=91329 /ORGANISM="Norrisiella sphaerica, Strain BC52" /LENGTH=240 /DNA_ID=CAMNT_0026888993 /DNA_START=432 /DNA_END=1151 /DNA_ORIENTATION=-
MNRSLAKEFLQDVVQSKRDIFISAGMGFHGHAVGLRRMLMEKCSKSEDCEECSGTVGCYVEQYARSTFCLMPAGDTPSRKGEVDALIAGCIPVLFDPYQLVLWRGHVGDWNDVAVYIPQQKWNDTFSILRSISSQRIESLQQNIQKISITLSTYRSEPNLGAAFLDQNGVEIDTITDAFSISLRKLWKQVQVIEKEGVEDRLVSLDCRKLQCDNSGQFKNIQSVPDIGSGPCFPLSKKVM